MVNDEKTTYTDGGANIEGEVNAGRNFIGRDKTEILIQRIEQKNAQHDYVEHQEITQVFLVVPSAQDGGSK